MQPPVDAGTNPNKRVSINVTNYSTKRLWLCIEMEGDGLYLEPREECDVVLISRDCKPLELDKLGIAFVMNDETRSSSCTRTATWNSGRAERC
jgi:hypothetical protein